MNETLEQTALRIWRNCNGETNHSNKAKIINFARRFLVEWIKQQKPVAFVADVYQSRYTLEWNGVVYPEGTKLYAFPITHDQPNAAGQELANGPGAAIKSAPVLQIALPNYTKTELTAADAMLAQVEQDYQELIMAVARKFPGETRHQTALRYILERESTRNEAGSAMHKEDKP